MDTPSNSLDGRMLARRLGVLSASLLVQRSAALHLPSAHLLATTARDACAALSVPKDEWLEPEDAAFAVARALSAISLPAAEGDATEGDATEGDAPPLPPLPPLPPQGEFVFSTDVHADRYAEAEEAAFAGDARAQHTLGLLLFGGVGGCEPDARHSAYWHTAAAAQGNLDALATLGGCVRRGETAGVAQDETVGVALITAAAEVRTTRTLSS